MSLYDSAKHLVGAAESLEEMDSLPRCRNSGRCLKLSCKPIFAAQGNKRQYDSTKQLVGAADSLEGVDSLPGSKNDIRCLQLKAKPFFDAKTSCKSMAKTSTLKSQTFHGQHQGKPNAKTPLREIPQKETCVHSLSLAPAKQGTKNLIILGITFMFVFTAFVTVKTMQSSFNSDDGIGVISLAVMYAMSVLSCFVSPWVIHKLANKRTIIVAFVMFLFYVGANFYPRHFLLIPASAILGLLKGPLWSAQSTYLTTLALNYATVTEQLPDLVINRFNGIFTGIFETSQVWGNLITALLLSTNNHTTSSNPLNQSVVGCLCGAKDCGHHNVIPDSIESASFTNIPPYLQYLILGILLSCVLTGVVICVTLLERVQMISKKDPTSQSSKQYIFATLKLMQNTNLVLLIPLVFFVGLEQGFIFGDFTKSYVNCALGVHHLGFTMVCFGTVSALTSVTIGHIGKHIKRFVLVGAGAMFHTGLLAVLLLWKPDGTDVPMFYVTAGCLGLCDAIWQTQSNRLFGLLFTENQEAAFANYRMFHASGHALAFGYSYFLCVDTKIYILGGALFLALGLYGLVEFRMRKLLTQTYDVVAGTVATV